MPLSVVQNCGFRLPPNSILLRNVSFVSVTAATPSSSSLYAEMPVRVLTLVLSDMLSYNYCKRNWRRREIIGRPALHQQHLLAAPGTTSQKLSSS